ncbi:hypothetical protein KR009_003470, partial [Drosophila setifemur]
LLATAKATTNQASYTHTPQYPYVVSIGENIRGDYKHLCVGVIISSEFLLSAAHCVMPLKDLKRPKALYVAGGADRLNSRAQLRFFVVAIKPHPQFKVLGGHDIALLQVYPKFPLDNVRFRSINFTSTVRQDGDRMASLLGWGRVSIRKVLMMQQLPFRTMKNDDCVGTYRFKYLKGSDICAMHLEGPLGACDGDSGGPLIDVKTELLYGLLSYGRKACQPKQPYAFTRISVHTSWISETMAKLKKTRAYRANNTVWNHNR